MIQIKAHTLMLKAFLINVLLLSTSLDGMLAELAVEQTPAIVRLLRNGSTPLHIAAHFDRVREIEELLKKGAEVHARDKDGATPLHIAAKRGNIRAVQALVPHAKREGWLDAYDNSGFTPLYYATSERKHEVIQCLLENGAQNRGAEGKSPLHRAAENGDLHAVKSIMGARPINDRKYLYCSYSYYSPLLSAAKSGSREVIDFFIEAGESVTVKGHEGTPLLVAARYGHVDAVRCLLEHGARLDKEGYDRKGAMQCAAMGGHVGMLEFLMELGLDINYSGGFEDSPIHLAVKNGHAGAADLLLSKGAHVDTCTLSNFMKHAAKSNDVKMLEVLLKHGAPINERGYRNPLIAAVKAGHVDATLFLLKRGAPIESALCVAAENGHLRIMELLLDCEAEIDKVSEDFSKKTSLGCAAMYGQVQAVQFLLRRGASVVRERLSEALSPLSHATIRPTPQKIKCAKLLLDAGAPVTRHELATGLCEKNLAAVRMMINAAPESIEYLIGEMRVTDLKTFEKMPEQVRNTIQEYFRNREWYLAEGRFRNGDNLDALFEVAAYCLDWEVLMILRSLGFDKLRTWRNEEGKNLFMLALEMHHLKAAGWFLDERICDINDTDLKGHDALWFAVGTGESSIVNQVLAAGAKVNEHHVLNASGVNNLALLMKLVVKYRYSNFPAGVGLNLFT